MSTLNISLSPTSIENAITMSSREIADLTGKRHDNVVRDIEKMLKDVEIDRLKFEGVYVDAKGEQRKCYNLPRDLTYNLILGYRADLRLKVVRRWMELEAQQAPALPKTYAEALLEAGRLAQERDKLAEEKKALEPKVAALDKLASLEGVHNLRSAAQQCGWPERKFINRLIELGWLYIHSVTGRKCAYADKIKAGLMESKNVEVKRSGYVEGVGQPMITQKGLAKIRTIIGDVPGDDTTLPAELARKATPRPFAHRSGATPT
ncbi:Rha family transcriptional regulator [Komagataeibacter sp. FNDCF1]|uniref:Rha family transcriptional regulator n=1 Tax=Komagataeibacter sp. FNDCF1 TaxID=2878681 RepID=UPI001E55236E|nr:phage regulatory protein/antirepressor Ant [Komagataeibacter sp. FNDCF1]MCE2564169.1 phage regulatory protein/antirepressor Ant [Komagataeibacter sp. FNDCF1]